MPSNHATSSKHARTRTRRTGLGIDAVLAAGAIALCAAVVAGFAWTKPVSTTARARYVQGGQMRYTAPTSPTSVYGGHEVTTGEPVYTSSVTTLSLSYRYHFSSSATTAISGTEQLVATVANGQGVARPIALQPEPTVFHGMSFAASAVFPMRTVEEIVAAYMRQVTSGSSRYTVSISPSIKITGRLDGARIATTFRKPVVLSYVASSSSGSGMLKPAATAANGAHAAPTGAFVAPKTAKGPSVLKVSSSGSLPLPAGKPALLFVGVPVIDARIASLAVIAAALLFGAFVGWRVLRDATSPDESTRIATRYGSSIVDVETLPGPKDVAVIDMSSFEALLAVARRLECPILHHRRGGDLYAVVDTGTEYRYTATSPQYLGTSTQRTPGRGSATEARGWTRTASSGRSPT